MAMNINTKGGKKTNKATFPQGETGIRSIIRGIVAKALLECRPPTTFLVFLLTL